MTIKLTNNVKYFTGLIFLKLGEINAFKETFTKIRKFVKNNTRNSTPALISRWVGGCKHRKLYQ